jgi:hypothetical protein
LPDIICEQLPDEPDRLSETDMALIEAALSRVPRSRLERNDHLRSFALGIWRSLMGVRHVKSTLDVLRCLCAVNLDFVLIGGTAATVHGSPRVAFDIDICAPITDENLTKISQAAVTLNSVSQDPGSQNIFAISNGKECFRGFANLHLITDAGPLDVLADVPGAGTFADCLADSELVDFDEFNCRILGLNSLIKSKTVAARLKDKLVILDLQAICSRRAQMSADTFFVKPQSQNIG